MIRRPDLVERFEAEDDRTVAQGRSFEEALARFTALWVEARSLNPDFGADWRSDLEADLAVARAVNGLPSRA